jgi:hypothetical protein
MFQDVFCQDFAEVPARNRRVIAVHDEKVWSANIAESGSCGMALFGKPVQPSRTALVA